MHLFFDPQIPFIGLFHVEKYVYKYENIIGTIHFLNSYNGEIWKPPKCPSVGTDWIIFGVLMLTGFPRS